VDERERAEIEDRLRRQIEAYHEAALLFTAVTCGLPDLMALSGPATPETLAAELGLQPSPLRRVLRGLATMRLCEELDDGRFALTPAGDLLTAGSGSSLREKAFVVAGQYWLPWLSLAHCLETGAPSFPVVFGSTLSDWRTANPEEGALFYRYLAKEELAGAGDLMQAFDAFASGTIASIGGGYGGFLLPLLLGQADVKAIVFDAQDVVEAAGPLFEAYGVTDRVRFVSGELLKDIPVEADIYVLKSVLQRHGDDEARTILENCRKAMKPGRRLIVYERLMPEKATDDPAAILLDLHMMAITGGRARTEEEMQTLIESAGLGIGKASKTAGGLAVIEAFPR